ncbi:MAG: segregation protein B [Flavobacteriaceae bacterium]|nr:segregation protein B [Flavobacteriaceae bacterium]|tara:strand:+ start:164635 stop:165303 length:669 start_codon:yes stop_codon:yes gene_type:complete
MKEKHVALIGATGLIGGHLLEYLLADDSITSVKLIVRRPVSFEHPKIEIAMIDFSKEDQFSAALKGMDVVFCSIGTTNKKVKGNKDAYRKVDYDITVNAAKFSEAHGCDQFVFVSSLGANSSSNNFYLKLKGQIEDDIQQLNLNSILIFRPSFLMGDRKEFRFGELLGIVFMKPFSFLLPSEIKPIYASEVAKAMLAATKKNFKGCRVFHFEEMKRLNSMFS